MGCKSDYDPSLCKEVIAAMTEGASVTEIAAKFGVHRSTLYLWMKAHPEFKDAMDRGTELSEAWWMEQGRTNLKNRDFCYVGWYMNMKNRFGWRDKQDVTSNNESINFVIKNA